MSDDKNKRGNPDRNRISLEEEYEVRHWTESLGVSREELEEAVKSVGNSAEKVREHFRSRSGGQGGQGRQGGQGGQGGQGRQGAQGGKDGPEER
ncbi:MAG TPA: DUF3606 domain-containing protein [Kofleriaceae bacterium]|nr:DUF3606 domain-containing protein [Kofleriaceae bacterium]